MEGRLQSIIVAVVAIVLALVATGASTAGGTTPSWILLGDNSLDATRQQRAEAIKILGEIADIAAEEQGTVAAAPFQTNALATVTWPIDHLFVPSPKAPNSYYRKVDLARQAEAVKRAAKRLFERQQKIQGTDIIGGLLAASFKFASQPPGPRTLVVASNMWAQSKDDGLALKKQVLSARQIQALVKRLSRAGRVADLHGVCVYVVGAGIDAWGQQPTSVQLSMRNFWIAYFAKTGASVKAWVPSLNVVPTC